MRKEIEISPSISAEKEIEKKAGVIREEIAPHVLSGAQAFIREHNLEGAFSLQTEREKLSWLYVIEGSRYNAIYFLSRSEAKKAVPFVAENADELEKIHKAVENEGGVNGIINFAIHEFVRDFSDGEREVRFSKKSIPSFAIQSYDEKTLYVKEKDFFKTEPSDSLKIANGLGDWHDFSHFLAAASNSMFGIRYHHGLEKLDRYYRDITEGTGMHDASGPAFTDGMIFTQLSRSLFEYFEKNVSSDAKLEEIIAEELVRYLQGEIQLYHPGANTYIQAPRPMNAAELAVCVQNKRCERQAAEFEKYLFVRGTPDGSRGNPSKDPFYELNISDRIISIAHTTKPLYFEKRNLVRHRAHEKALGLYTQWLLADRISLLESTKDGSLRHVLQQEIRLLEAIDSFVRLEDVQKGSEINLYHRVEEYLQSEKSL